MKKCLVIISASAICLLAAWWFSPEQVVKRRCASLFDVLTIDLSKPPTTRALAVYSLHQLLAPEVELSTPTPEDANGIFAREELESAFSSICQHASQCLFTDLQFDVVNVAGNHASVSLILHAWVEFPEMRVVDGFYRVNLDWQRGDKDWLLKRAVGEPFKDMQTTK